MLRLLSLTRNIIPYVRELRELPLVKSITSALLMQQLDYWFERSPDGFYKFLAPCDNEYYKAGDSWVEELGFSKDEFRTAFDNLGIRYASKSQFLKAVNPFLDSKGEEKYYCSYTDKTKSVTYYLRNNSFTDKSLRCLLGKPSSEKEDFNFRESGTPISVNRECQSLRIENDESCKSGMPIPILYTEITTDINSPSISPPNQGEERERNFGFQIPEQELFVNTNSASSNNSQTTSQSEQYEAMTQLPSHENNSQTQTYDPYFHRRRAKPNETQWDWLPDGPWKTDLGKLDDAFVMDLAAKWAKRYGGTPQDKKPNAIKHFRNDPTNLPIEWECYQESFLHRAANLQVRKSHGIDTEAEEIQLMKQARAVTPLDDSQRVTESHTPFEVIEACADYALPTIEQTATKEMIAPDGAEGAEAYTRTVTLEDAEFWRNRTISPASRTKKVVSSAELEKAKSQIENLKQLHAKSPRHSQEEDISEIVDSASFLEDMRKFLRFGSPKMKDEAIAWAKDPINGCELVVKDGVVVDIKEVDF